MKKLVLLVMAMFVVAVAGLAFADNGKGKFEGKAGDEIYVCACGAACKCAANTTIAPPPPASIRRCSSRPS